jgi:hypothetical protein
MNRIRILRRELDYTKGRKLDLLGKTVWYEEKNNMTKL